MKVPPIVPAGVLAAAAVVGGLMFGGSGGAATGTSTVGEPAGHGAAPAKAGAGAPHWGYEGKAGPARWATLDKAFEACGKGLHQSPIDIERTTKIGLDDLDLRYKPESYEVIDTGHAIQANAAGTSALVLDGSTYALVQLHVHTPSEHVVHGRPAAAEIHLVHRDDHGEVAVVGVLVEQGASNPALDPILGALPEAEGAVSRPKQPFDPATLLPADRHAVRYEGSLTTPPCTEGVRWSVLLNPIQASKAQIDAFEARHPGNARPLQDRHERPLLEDAS